ncbi:MAG: aspartate-semialdehyde dehydrogenase, partial [Candidatus Lightella neohaematopini]|nr:aspartate-semialdehyde dehydrogenase [Candidatus Lightella neohaematopini]
LDPINLSLIFRSLDCGIKNFVSGNCTVNLLLMSLGGLFTNNLIDWISIATYQAASGGGAKYMLALINQLKSLNILNNNKLTVNNITTIERNIRENILHNNYPIAYNIIPWIGNKKIKEQSLEEWKSQVEINKIINTICSPIKIDGICVRVNTLRCHSQALTVRLKKDLTINDITQIILNHNRWIKFIPNSMECSINQLHPLAISNTLNIAIGRLRKLNIGNKYLTLFTIGDQLLWGAAEPIRRMLKLLIKLN